MYQLIICPKCKHPQLTTSKLKLLCKYCGKTVSINKLTILYKSFAHKDALNALYNLQKNTAEK